jgi:hypothetical protein
LVLRAQNLQPLFSIALFLMGVSQTWRGSVEHIHHARRLEFGNTSEGFNVPFLVGCHSAATFGNATSSFGHRFGTAIRAQNGQPDFNLVRL